MTFHSLAALAAQEILRDKSVDSMWDLGNQRFTATPRVGIRSTADFYRSFGCAYRAIDVNTEMEADIGDLNHPLAGFPPRPLVVNNGTSEHIFNQAAVFENIHRLSRKHMLHILPFTPWINHGFFNYNPIMFRDLAAANRYEIQSVAIGGRAGQRQMFAPDSEVLYNGKRAAELMKLVVHSIGNQEAFLVFHLKHTRYAPFRFPIQGRYLMDIETSLMKLEYTP